MTFRLWRCFVFRENLLWFEDWHKCVLHGIRNSNRLSWPKIIKIHWWAQLVGEALILKSLVHLDGLLSSAVRALLQLLSLTIFGVAQSPASDSLTDSQWQFQDFSGYIEQFPGWPTLPVRCSICELFHEQLCACDVEIVGMYGPTA